MKKLVSTCYLLSLIISSFAQTIPVTFHLDANNTQHQTVQLWYQPDYLSYTDEDGDRIFELTLELEPGEFNYHLLRDNAWGWDPDNPLYGGKYPTNGASMIISDPMISYLLPKDGDMLRENRIQANFAYTANNPLLANSISVTINGNAVPDPTRYFDPAKRELLINNPPFIVNGLNTVLVSYTTSKGSISRISSFTYQPIKLMIDTMMYRMDHILGWGRVFTKPYPTSVFLQCNNKIYTTGVNAEGYFGADIDLVNGANSIQAAYTEAGLANPTDQMTVNAEIRHKWWVELTGTINGATANIQATPHDIDPGSLSFNWGQPNNNPAGLSVSGSSSSLSFDIPAQEGNFMIELLVTTNSGETYTARKLLTTKGAPHFIGVNERAPWMETMVLYEVEGDFFDWGLFSFQNMKQTFQHMKDLGVNSFRITPFVSGGFISWDHFDIYPPYGSMADLHSMIETAHQYGLKVFFDVPLSHIASFHPFILPNFLLKDKAEPYFHFNLWKGNPGESDIVNSPTNGRQCVYTDLDNPYTQEYFTRLMEHWVEVAGCDGFRIDCGQESFLRSPDYIKYLHQRLRNINPNLFILEEGDNRQDPEVNYYDFGDAAYDWYLNGWNNNSGFPGVFNGTYSIDQLHELLTTGTPDRGLVMRYINTGYFDYFSRRFGNEQERTGVAIITTTYGLPNIRGGEEVGLTRANGMIDCSDPLGVTPFYTRLIKARQGLLGNYPTIERITQNIPSQVYAYTSKSNGRIVLTVANFTGSQTPVTIDLQNSVFQNKGQTNWYNIVEDVEVNNSGRTSFTIALAPWKTEVFALDCTKGEVFPAANSITITTSTGENTIVTNGGSLQFIAFLLPENSMDDVIWSFEGDTHLATFLNGTLTACNCGAGTVTVVATSATDPAVKARMVISISNQISGQVTNATFDSNIDGWFLWTPVCNNTSRWDNGEARISYANGSADCWSQFMSNNDIRVETTKTYRVSFDARATLNKDLSCVIREGGNNYAPLSNEVSFQLTTGMQQFSFEFTATQTCTIAQVHFNMGAGNADFWIDNVTICEKVHLVEKVDITFQVDLQNEQVTNSGVYLNGSFCKWNTGNAVKLTPNGTIYSTILKLNKGETIEYKFVNGSAGAWNRYETLTGTCAYGNDNNRMLVVPDTDATLDLVCFKSCSTCSVSSDNYDFLNLIKVFPNPVRDKIVVSGLGDKNSIIKLFRIDGLLMMEYYSNYVDLIELDLHNYNTGIYIICIENDLSKKYFKIVKE